MTWAFILDSVPFTHAVIAGETSLGGSESACLGLARALRRQGEDVHLFVTQLEDTCSGRSDATGVVWHHLNDFVAMNQFLEWDVVVALRMFAAFAYHPVYARLRLLWNQDLLVPGNMQNGVMGVAWALDHVCYVSEYHRKQWEALQPELTPLGWVTRNGFDPADLPTDAKPKDPHRIIHTSRPERGLGPLLGMWPALKAKRPEATLQVCRYSSMYDTGPGSWSDECARWDARVAEMNADVGGITYLGELTKPQLYQAISEAAVVWYPGVAGFAETNCISALEAAACGTPFVGSYRGALPETSPTGILIHGDPKDEAYRTASVQAVCDLLDGCAAQSFDYRRRQKDGRKDAGRYTYDILAAQWLAQVHAWFAERYESNKPRVLRQLLHEDDHTAAKMVAHEIQDWELSKPLEVEPMPPEFHEAMAAEAFCDYVIAGKDQNAEHYGAAAVQDPLKEAEFSDRFKAVIPYFEKATRVLDVACGNGSFAIALAKANPTVFVYGLDYSAANIEHAIDGAKRAGVADRCRFQQCTVYDFDAQALHADFTRWVANWTWTDARPATYFDGLFVGEFIEHVGNYQAVIDGLEDVLIKGAVAVYTCPHGACAELMPRDVPLRRGHVHRFHHDDLRAVFGPKQDFSANYLDAGITPRGNPIGNWLIRYTVDHARRAGTRPLNDRILRTRPLQRISVGLLTKDAENDLGRCLASVYAVADEILVGDTGSTDTTKQIAATYGPKVRLVDLQPIADYPDGFAGARNALKAQCAGDWFLWIDSDEALHQGPLLRRYLDGAIYQGFVLKQTHLYLDAAPTWDIPVRLFRHRPDIQFYGCVHEQPQDGDANADIYPTLDPADVRLIHIGYLTEEAREEKRVSRNLPLLMRDATVFPQRVLGKVLLLREAVIQADALCAALRGLTPKAQQAYAYAIRLFIEHFDDPAHKYHKLARPWYEAALRHLGLGWEQEVAMAGKQGGLEHRHAQPERFWVRDADEYQRILTFKIQGVATAMLPVTFVTDPDQLMNVEPERMEVSA